MIEQAEHESSQLEITSNRLLVISHDHIGQRMAGPGIRSWELARVLSKQQPITLIAPQPIDLAEQAAPLAERLTLGSYTWSNASTLQPWLTQADIVVANGYLLQAHPELATLTQPLVLDLYDPTLLENLELFRNAAPTERATRYAQDQLTLSRQLAAGDFFLCATERQRDLYIGALIATGRLSPAYIDSDPDLRRLIDVVPFGLTASPPEHQQPALRGVIDGIAIDDPLLLWTGGLWDWMDPLTLIEALPTVSQQHPNTRLVFLAGQHPNHDRPTQTTIAARRRAEELGLLGQSVFFYDEWVPYTARASFLLEATIAVSLHHNQLETQYSAIRSRILDHLWAGLPSVLSDGDPAAALLTAEQAALVAAPDDPAAVAAALNRLLSDTDLRSQLATNARSLASRFTWETVALPLARFCATPYHTRPVKAMSAPAPEPTAPAPEPEAANLPEPEPEPPPAAEQQDYYKLLEQSRNAAVTAQEQTWHLQEPSLPVSRLTPARRVMVDQIVRPYVEPLRAQQQTYNTAVLRTLYAINQMVDYNRNDMFHHRTEAVQRTDRIEKRLDSVEQFAHYTQDEIDRLDLRINDEIGRVDARINDETQRIDIRETLIEQRIDDLEQMARYLEAHMQAQLEVHIKRIAALETRAEYTEKNERLLQHSLAEIIEQLAGLEEADTQLVLALQRAIAQHSRNGKEEL